MLWFIIISLLVFLLCFELNTKTNQGVYGNDEGATESYIETRRTLRFKFLINFARKDKIIVPENSKELEALWDDDDEDDGGMLKKHPVS